MAYLLPGLLKARAFFSGTVSKITPQNSEVLENLSAATSLKAAKYVPTYSVFWLQLIANGAFLYVECVGKPSSMCTFDLFTRMHNLIIRV